MNAQLQFFTNDVAIAAPSTEGIKYAGSKLKLIPHILRLANRVNAKSFIDGFSGTTRVSQAFAKAGYDVVCNDIAAWSEVFGNCYLLAQPSSTHFELIAHLNALPPRDGWFTSLYGGEERPNGVSAKRPWQLHNTRKLDAIREEIDRLSLNPLERCVALTSLILALDQVDSTLGHFVSYLREWSPRSYKTLRLRVPAIVEASRERQHRVTRTDVFALAANTVADLAYFDPPYGSNNEKMPPSRVRYASYYHVWTSVCLHDKPKVFGKANRRIDTSDKVAISPFEEFRRGPNGTFIAVDAIARLLSATRARHIILSYSSGGRATSAELSEAIQSCGRLLEVVEVDYRRNVMAGMRWTNEWLSDAESPNREFLFLIERN